MTLARPSTPPLGWNSWDCYGTTVTEAEVLANAGFLARHLAPRGWNTIVVDIDWADPTARAHGYTPDAPLLIDGHGRLLPDPVRFPSAAGGAGFAPLAERIHAMGLRFGIHVMRGVPRRAVDAATPVLGTSATAADVADRRNACEWNPHNVGLDHSTAAAGAYYRSLVELYAEWGVDFLKVDDMLWPYQASEIEAFAAAVAASPREFVLSLSPGRDLSIAHLAHLREHASMWRICDDVWDRWQDVVDNVPRLARWAPQALPGAWPDADMLPLGRIGLRAERGEPRDDAFTPDERRTMLTLWAIARSPLMIGGDLPSSDPATIALLGNPGVLELQRTARSSGETLHEGPLLLWWAESESARWASVTNLGDAELDPVLDTASLGLGPEPGPLREEWSGAPVATERIRIQSDAARGVAPGSSAVRLRVAPHGSLLLRADR